jgi:hypothetical protein
MPHQAAGVVERPVNILPSREQLDLHEVLLGAELGKNLEQPIDQIRTIDLWLDPQHTLRKTTSIKITGGSSLAGLRRQSEHHSPSLESDFAK